MRLIGSLAIQSCQYAEKNKERRRRDLLNNLTIKSGDKVENVKKLKTILVKV